MRTRRPTLRAGLAAFACALALAGCTVSPSERDCLAIARAAVVEFEKAREVSNVEVLSSQAHVGKSAACVEVTARVNGSEAVYRVWINRVARRWALDRVEPAPQYRS